MAIDQRFYSTDGAAVVEDWARATGATLSGEGACSVLGVGGAATARPGEICFYEGDRRGAADISAEAVACFIGEDNRDAVPEGVTALIHPQPRLAFCRHASTIFRRRTTGGQRDFIHAGASVHADARLGPGVVVGDGAAIGAGTDIGANTVIGPGVQIGQGSVIGPNVSIQCALIGNGVTLSAGVRIGESGFGVMAGEAHAEDVPHFGRAIVQDGVSLGANTCVDRGMFDDTVVGEHTKVDNFCQIAHNSVLGRNVVMVAYSGVAGSVTLGDGVVLGGRAGVADHVVIETGAQLAASTGVFRDVPAGETWGGTPGRPIKQWLRETAWLQKQVAPKKKPQ